MTKYMQGRFKPQNPQKYVGDPSNIIYRSSWELNYLMRLDRNENVLEYSSEELVIPYVSPLDGKVHRYFPDFRIKLAEPNNKSKTMIIEIKPATQTMPPKQPKRITKKFLERVAEYEKNQAKWHAAKEYCKDRGYEFQVLTEHDLGLAHK